MTLAREGGAQAMPRLLAITDLTLAPPERWLERLDTLALRMQPGALGVMLRDHQLPARARLGFGQMLRELTRGHGQQLWVADRLDLALLLGADGVHLGEGSVPARAMTPLWSGRVSRAWHESELAPAHAPELASVDALLVSPVLAARKGRAPLGLERLATLARQADVVRPFALYALGGVTATMASACVAAGAWGVAAIGAVLTDEAGALALALDVAR